MKKWVWTGAALLGAVIIVYVFWIRTAGNEAAVASEDFVYRIYTEKESYKEGDTVKLIAELEYVGERKSVTIFHTESPFYFPILEMSDTYGFPSYRNQPGRSTILYRNKPLKEEFVSDGAYEIDKTKLLSIGKKAHVAFPAAHYEVNGYAEFEPIETSGEKGPMIKIGSKLALEVEAVEEGQALSNTSRALTATQQYDASTFLLATVPGKSIYLYGANDGGVVLKTSSGEQRMDKDWSVGEHTDLRVSDYDGDGKEELAAAVYLGGGTGVSGTALYVVEMEGQSPFRHFTFLSEQYEAQLLQQVKFELTNVQFKRNDE
ncbi:hypothetical protein ACFQZE_13455 [Paenibacillus sp. GCM10027627]|uniref:hypothetical protein n=1 Tax=unclassified Paenibacillus TaxID=185978 RepID=UPI003643042A